MLHVVSVDILLIPTWGDVTRRETQQFWYHGVRQKFVVAYLAGPPCETWSRAREVASSADDRRAPRVVRDISHIWGLPALSVREVRQVLTGNELLLFSFVMLALLSGTGGCGALEHPAMPEKPTSVSIWRTVLVNLLLRIPGFEFIPFSQGLLGARSAKPTSMLLLNLPEMGRSIHQARVCSNLPATSSIGKSLSGHWNTLGLKEYPPGLCRAMAQCIVSTVSRLEIDTGSVMDQDFWNRCRAMVVDRFDQCLGPDYAA